MSYRKEKEYYLKRNLKRPRPNSNKHNAIIRGQMRWGRCEEDVFISQ